MPSFLRVATAWKRFFVRMARIETLLTGGVYLFGDHPQLFRWGAFDRRFSR